MQPPSEEAVSLGILDRQRDGQRHVIAERHSQSAGQRGKPHQANPATDLEHFARCRPIRLQDRLSHGDRAGPQAGPVRIRFTCHILAPSQLFEEFVRFPRLNNLEASLREQDGLLRPSARDRNVGHR